MAIMVFDTLCKILCTLAINQSYAWSHEHSQSLLILDLLCHIKMTALHVDVLLGRAWASPTLIGTMAHECFYQSIYLSRGSVCPFQCSREVGNALFSTCAHYNWRLVSNKISTWHSSWQWYRWLRDDNNRDQRHLKTNNFYTTRPLPESDDTHRGGFVQDFSLMWKRSPRSDNTDRCEPQKVHVACRTEVRRRRKATFSVLQQNLQKVTLVRLMSSVWISRCLSEWGDRGTQPHVLVVDTLFPLSLSGTH